MSRKDQSVLFLMFLAMFFWGSNFNAASALAGSVPPLTAGAERFAIAALVFLLMRLWRRPESVLSGKAKLQLVGLGILGVFGFNFAFFYGLQTTSALNGALIMATSPLVTTLLAAVLIGGVVGLQHWFGAVLGFCGVALVIFGGGGHQLHLAIGDLYMIGACLCWSLYTVCCKKYAGNVPALQLSRWSIGAGAVSLLIAALWMEQPLTFLPHLDIQFHLILLYMGLFGSVLAYIFWLQGVQTLGPGRAALFFNLVPVFTLLVGIGLGDLPRPAQLVGMVLVMLGVLIGNGVILPRLFAKRSEVELAPK